MSQIVKLGFGISKDLELFLKEYKPKSIFLVTGKNSYLKCGAEEKLEPILKNYNYTYFSDFEKNPKIEDVERGVEIFNNNKCDFIIAVGGGSVIDIAKLILFFNNKSKPYFDSFKSNLNEQDKHPLIVLPTTAGSGSEATHFAVVYVNKIKFSIADNNLLPDKVLIDYDFLKSQSKNQIIYSGLDAFCQGIESFWCINSTNESIIYSTKAISYSWNNLLKAVNGEDVFEQIAKASYYAGKAINITKTTGPHALSYTFTTNFGIPHGHAVAIFLPFFINFHKNIQEENSNDVRGHSFVLNQMLKLSNILSIDYNNFEFEVIRFFNKLGIELNFNKLSIDRKAFLFAVKDLNEERLKNNPRILSRKDLDNIFHYNSKI